MAFFSGSTGGIYRQFAVTLAIAVAISTVMALVLTPALCATLLSPGRGAGERGRMPRPLRVLNRGLDGTATGYHRAVGGMLQRPIWFLVIFAGLVALAATRSEEHTSELQSLMRISYAVFCLKKKKK